jgi:hypothetical protein
MRMERQGHVYPPYRLKPDRALGQKYLRAQGIESPGSGPVPLTYMIFLRGERLGVNLFEDLDIPRNRALHGGQRYEWYSQIGWDDEIEVSARVARITEKASKSGPIWFADVEYDYRRMPGGDLVLREATRIIKRG